jgi:hypothetical protein
MQQTVVGIAGVTAPVGCGIPWTEQLPALTVTLASTLPGAGLRPEYAWHEVPTV